jgi:hypothetical protein
MTLRPLAQVAWARLSFGSGCSCFPMQYIKSLITMPESVNDTNRDLRRSAQAYRVLKVGLSNILLRNKKFSKPRAAGMAGYLAYTG